MKISSYVQQDHYKRNGSSLTTYRLFDNFLRLHLTAYLKYLHDRFVQGLIVLDAKIF
jgi:hypothetical protein